MLMLVSEKKSAITFGEGCIIVISKKTSTYLSYKVNIAAADDLETQGARASVSSHGTDLFPVPTLASEETGI